ncbi:MAG: hypothetical protein KDH84_05535, partial [Calditrichaeota bacterium]|nr:hypothetical protein [Calditrichota bacterium]
MKFKFLIAVLIVCSFSSAAFSQDLGSQPSIQIVDRPAQYILGSGDMLLINVNLWGHVLKPGIYSIP